MSKLCTHCMQLCFVRTAAVYNKSTSEKVCEWLHKCLRWSGARHNVIGYYCLRAGLQTRQQFKANPVATWPSWNSALKSYYTAIREMCLEPIRIVVSINVNSFLTHHFRWDDLCVLAQCSLSQEIIFGSAFWIQASACASLVRCSVRGFAHSLVCRWLDGCLPVSVCCLLHCWGLALE